MTYNYKLQNFVSEPSDTDKTLKIYTKSGRLIYTFVPDMAYFFYKNNFVIIKIEDQDNIVLDFENASIAMEALKKLNRIKKTLLEFIDPLVVPIENTLVNLDDTFIDQSILSNESFLKYDVNLSGWTNFELCDLSSSTFSNDSLTPFTVGGISAGSSFDQKNMSEMWNHLLYPTIMPTSSAKYASISGVNTTSVEVGTHFTFSLGYSFNQGSIDSKDNHPNIPLVGSEVSNIFSGPGLSGNNVDFIATDGNMNWGVTVYHNAGTGDYFDSTGTVATNLDSQRNAGNSVSSSNKRGYYYYYIDENNAPLPTDTVSVRSMSRSFRTSSNFSFTYTIPKENRYFAFFLDGVQKTILSALDLGTNAQYKNNFIITGPFGIEDANGTLRNYYKYEQDIGGIGYTADATYNITIG